LCDKINVQSKEAGSDFESFVQQTAQEKQAAEFAAKRKIIFGDAR